MNAELTTWPETKKLQTLLVFEEAHRYIQGGELEGILELLARTARARGLGLLFISQNVTDTAPGIRNNAATRIQMQTGYGPDLTRAAQVFGSDIAKKIPALPQGLGAINYPDHGSALVAVRPPLHSPHAIGEDVARFFTVSKDLKRAVSDMMARRVATGDTKNRSEGEKGSDAVITLPNPETTRDWRDVATRVAPSRQTAQEVREEIRTQGTEPPSLRTLQRFLKTRSTKGSSGH